MTSPVPNEHWYNSVKIVGLGEKYYSFKETPLASVLKYYYDFTLLKYARDRMFQAFWAIQGDGFLFEYALPINGYSKFDFNAICLKENFGIGDQVRANWFSGKINIQIQYDLGFLDGNGSCPDIRITRVYSIRKGIITNMVEEKEFFDPVPF